MSTTDPIAAADITRGFTHLFGEGRGYREPSVFADPTRLSARSRYSELVRLLSEDGNPKPALAELLRQHRDIDAYPLAVSLREHAVEHLCQKTMQAKWHDGLLFSEATRLHEQRAEEILAGGSPLRLHLWERAHEHGVELTDLEGEEKTVCGLAVWDCRRVHRGAWQEQTIRQNGNYEKIGLCPTCAQRASEFPDCQETSSYPPLAPGPLAQLEERVRQALARAMALRRLPDDPEVLLRKLRMVADGAYERGLREISAQLLAGDRAAYERLLGAERYFKLERELRRAGIAVAVEQVLKTKDLSAILVSDDALSSAHELSLRIEERVRHESGLSDCYLRRHPPRPTWARA